MAEAGPGRRGGLRALLTAASTAFSLALHGGVLAAVFLLIEDTPGAVSVPTEAISLELFQTEVLEAVAQSASLEAAASFASVQSDPGEAIESVAASASAEAKDAPPEVDVPAAREEPDEVEAEEPEGLAVLEGAVESEVAAGKEHEAPRRREKKPEAVPERDARAQPVKTAKLPDAPEKRRDAESPAKKKGAAAARASQGSAASTGRVSASAGSAVNYAARVRARVASRRPGGGGQRGTVVISFGVTKSGGLSYASIARSSGNPGLDRSVLSAVRGAAPFPTPPPGAQLRFSVPFYFR